MSKNSDTKNIFDSYFNKVVLKEAVKPTESDNVTSSNDPDFIKKALQNPNLTQANRETLENRLKNLGNTNNQQASNVSLSDPSTASSLSLDSGNSTTQSDSDNRAKFDAMFPPREEYEQRQAASSAASQPAPNATPSTTPSAKVVAPPKNRAEAAAMRDRGEKPTNLEAEYNKKLGRTPGFADPDNFRNVDRPGNAERFPDMVTYKKQLQSGQVAPAIEQPSAPASQPATSQTTPQSTDDFQKKLDAQFAEFQKGPSSSESQTDDFQKKLDAQFADFQKGGATQQPAQAATQPAQAATQPKTPTTSGGSIVDYLASKGQATDKASRAKMAADYGIQNYSGTAEQNTQLLNKLKSGEKPTQKAAPQQKGMGGAVGGVSKAVGSAGQGIKQAAIGNKKPLGGILGGISKGLGSIGKGVKTALVGNQEEEEEGWVEQGEPEVENVSDEYDTEETPTQYKESVAIAKFLKRLSEKNYHQANIHLNQIIQNKVKSKINNLIK